MAESKEELKSLLMKVKEESDKVGFITQHSKNKDHGTWSHQFMANRWGNNDRLYFQGFRIPEDGDYSHETKRCLLLGRKAMTNIDRVLQSRDITLPTKVHRVKVMVFPVVMYGCESWTIKRTELRRTVAFKLCCWRRHLRVPKTARRSNQSLLKRSVLGVHWKD